MLHERSRRIWIPALIVWGLAAAPAGSAPEVSARRNDSSTKLTPECRTSIDNGIKWLISAMKVDGGVGPDIDRDPELGCTAMVGLALLAEGNTPCGGPHHKELRRVLHAVLNMVDRRGAAKTLEKPTLVRYKIGSHADLFIAALFLTQVYGEAPDDQEDIRRVLEELIATICDAQGTNGTWGEDSWAPVLGTVLGWESLRAAGSCGLRVNGSERMAGEALFKQLRDQSEDQRGWMHNFYKTAASIRVLHASGHRDDPVCKECIARILKVATTDSRPFTVAGGEEYLAFFFVTECLLEGTDEARQTWYPIVSKNLIKVQNEDGSWSGHHCITGRTFCTAAALMTLQARNLYLPISEL